MNDKWFCEMPKYRHWTQTAVFCYERGGNCCGCPIKNIIETECKMKYSVNQLVKTLGIPKEETENEQL